MYGDVYNYLILTPSLYTHEQLKTYKSLKAFNEVVNGWVRDVICSVSRSSSTKLYLFTALVKHSQSLSLPSLKVWVSVKQSGEVLCAHCTSMAGAGEACSHIASVLFMLELNTQMKQQFSCTSLPCSWLPSTFRSVPFSEIGKIDFTTPKHKRKQTVTEGCGDPSTKSKKFSIPKSTDSDLATFHNEMSQGLGKPVVLSLMAEYNDSYVPETESGVLPKPLTELHDPTAMEMAYNDLLTKCEDIYETVSFTFNQAVMVEERTREQSKCRAWFEQRAGRITASKLREALHTNHFQPSVSLIKAICYPEQHKFTSSACQYGCKHEDIARVAYTEKMQACHENFMVIQCGLILDPEFPFLGATPDGLVYCKCCESRVLEIKCPFSCKNKAFSEAILDNSSFFLEDDNGGLALKEDHMYYYQIQLQMKLCHMQHCDFVAWREGEIFHQMVELDSDFIDSAIHDVEPFIKLAILPELVGKWFSKQPIMPLQSSSSTAASGGASSSTSMSVDASVNQVDSTDSHITKVDATAGSRSNDVHNSSSSDEQEGYCYCGKGEDYDNMICCDNKDCLIGWFHFSCLKMTKKDVPKGKYFCPDCHNQRSSKRSKKAMKHH